MEPSAFNALAAGEGGETLLFNTLSGHLAVLDVEGLAAYREAAPRAAGGSGAARESAAEACAGAVRTVDGVAEASSTDEGTPARDAARAALADAGFLVPSARDQRRSQRERFQRMKADGSRLTLCLAPTYDCNFACPYCYEAGTKPGGAMPPAVQDAVMRFIERLHGRDGFAHLDIQWYGGEPLLAFGVMEALSERMMEFCHRHGIAYAAELISNASLVTPEKARRLAQLGVAKAMPTLDGLAPRQNIRRPDRAGRDSFEAVMAGVRALRDAGIAVNLMLNLDGNNGDDFRSLRPTLAREGIGFEATLLKDYGHCFGCGDSRCGGFAGPEFDLMDRTRFCAVQHRLFCEDHGWSSASDRREEPAKAAAMARIFVGLLAPAPVFCRGQLGSYFAIDCLGDAYKCDGWMGDRSRALFNLLEPYDVAALDRAVAAFGPARAAGQQPPCRQVDARGVPAYNPYDDPFCDGCALLPLCLGECAWDRELIGDSCHVLKDSLPDYLRDYRACFGPVQGPVALLA